MRWWWVRHAPTHAKTMVGWTDLPADLSNSAQIARVRTYLPHAPMVSSDLSRARDTATALRNAHPRLPDSDALREINFGQWENRRFDEIEDQALLRQYWDQPGTVSPPGGESWHGFQSRVNAFVDPLSQASRHRDIIVVAHMGVILSQVQRALDVGAFEAFAQKIDNLSVTTLRYDGGRWHAEEINHAP